MGVLEFLQANWALIVATPLPFIATAILFLGLGFAVGRWVFSERIQLLEGRVAARDDRIDDYERKLGGASPDEARADILDLQKRLAQLEPRQLSDAQLKEMRAVLSSAAGAVEVTRDMSAPSAVRIYGQFADLAQECGWEVQKSQVLTGDLPKCGVRIISRHAEGEGDAAELPIIIRAFDAASVRFERRDDKSRGDRPAVLVLFSEIRD